MESQSLKIYVGYDERQSESYKVCKQSILETASQPVEIIPLKHQELRDQGLFTRPWTIKESGEFIDNVDGKPFSTQFSHSRFLVPHLARTVDAPPYAVFVDSDFCFLTDIYELIRLVAKDSEHLPVYCVKHNYSPKSVVKMDGRQQVGYNKKLWTSLMVFDLRHNLLDNLVPKYVNSTDGRDLHQFKWLNNIPDPMIGSIPEFWNFIPGHSDKHLDKDTPVNAIHYTEGTPHMKGYEHCDLADFYWGAYTRSLMSELEQIEVSRFKPL